MSHVRGGVVRRPKKSFLVSLGQSNSADGQDEEDEEDGGRGHAVWHFVVIWFVNFPQIPMEPRILWLDSVPPCGSRNAGGDHHRETLCTIILAPRLPWILRETRQRVRISFARILPCLLSEKHRAHTVVCRSPCSRQLEATFTMETALTGRIRRVPASAWRPGLARCLADRDRA